MPRSAAATLALMQRLVPLLPPAVLVAYAGALAAAFALALDAPVAALSCAPLLAAALLYLSLGRARPR